MNTSECAVRPQLLTTMMSFLFQSNREQQQKHQLQHQQKHEIDEIDEEYQDHPRLPQHQIQNQEEEEQQKRTGNARGEDGDGDGVSTSIRTTSVDVKDDVDADIILDKSLSQLSFAPPADGEHECECFDDNGISFRSVDTDSDIDSDIDSNSDNNVKDEESQHRHHHQQQQQQQLQNYTDDSTNTSVNTNTNNNTLMTTFIEDIEALKTISNEITAKNKKVDRLLKEVHKSHEKLRDGLFIAENRALRSFKQQQKQHEEGQQSRDHNNDDDLGYHDYDDDNESKGSKIIIVPLSKQLKNIAEEEKEKEKEKDSNDDGDNDNDEFITSTPQPPRRQSSSYSSSYRNYNPYQDDDGDRRGRSITILTYISYVCRLAFAICYIIMVHRSSGSGSDTATSDMNKSLRVEEMLKALCSTFLSLSVVVLFGKCYYKNKSAIIIAIGSVFNLIGSIVFIINTTSEMTYDNQCNNEEEEEEEENELQFTQSFGVACISLAAGHIVDLLYIITAELFLHDCWLAILHLSPPTFAFFGFLVPLLTACGLRAQAILLIIHASTQCGALFLLHERM